MLFSISTQKKNLNNPNSLGDLAHLSSERAQILTMELELS